MKEKVRYECPDCGCYFWVDDRNNFECPNCEEKKLSESLPKDLFSDEVLPQIKNIKKSVNPCIALYGETKGEICRDCYYLIYKQGSVRYYKCRYRKNTASPHTDHRVRWPACGKFKPK